MQRACRATPLKGVALTREEIIKLERYLQRVFKLQSLQVKQRPRKDDSAEVYVGDEFIGVLFKDEEEGETSYQFQMAILDFDLES
jgi:hypothetical protein